MMGANHEAFMNPIFERYIHVYMYPSAEKRRF
jgi:hypothetical protein